MPSGPTAAAPRLAKGKEGPTSYLEDSKRDGELTLVPCVWWQVPREGTEPEAPEMSGTRRAYATRDNNSLPQFSFSHGCFDSVSFFSHPLSRSTYGESQTMQGLSIVLPEFDTSVKNRDILSLLCVCVSASGSLPLEVSDRQESPRHISPIYPFEQER